MPRITRGVALLFLGASFAHIVQARECPGTSARYRALRHDAPTRTPGTWDIRDRDGANRPVEPYLSSLAGGEGGTGTIASPPFTLAADRVAFTICGHDGQGGGQEKNFVALVDANSGMTLKKTLAPGADPMQSRCWDVTGLRGRKVRIEVHDGVESASFAWLGIGSIDAGPGMQVSFRGSMPAGWTSTAKRITIDTELVEGGVPFRAVTQTLMVEKGSARIPCGFTAQRLFFLGGTVAGGQPLDVHGHIEIQYRRGPTDRYPLMVGHTLDGAFKVLGRSSAMYLHVSGDPFQYYLAVAPRSEVIEAIRLETDPGHHTPRISAITCETAASGGRLEPLPDCKPGAAEEAWIRSHTLSPGVPARKDTLATIRQAHRIRDEASRIIFEKHQLDSTFRSEGVAVADVNGDGKKDILAGALWYEAPRWTPHEITTPGNFVPEKGYSNSFGCFADDLNGDGAPDLIVVDFPGAPVRTYENPGAGKLDGHWREHRAFGNCSNESPHYVDLRGDGTRELVCGSDQERMFRYTPGKTIDAPWSGRSFSGPRAVGAQRFSHGLGVDDLNGDGRRDVIVGQGWYEAPAKASGDRNQEWTFHRVFPASPVKVGGKPSGHACAQMHAHDFDADGDMDILASSAHNYGIWWLEQQKAADGQSTWVAHLIDMSYSQHHSLAVADINRDGLPDFITGKRWYAHLGRDPGGDKPAVLLWYELTRRDGTPRWIRHSIDSASGIGTQFEVTDVNGDGLEDIVTSNKKGVFYFEQQGVAREG